MRIILQYYQFNCKSLYCLVIYDAFYLYDIRLTFYIEHPILNNECRDIEGNLPAH